MTRSSLLFFHQNNHIKMNKIIRQKVFPQRFKQFLRQIELSRTYSGEERDKEQKPPPAGEKAVINREKGGSNKKESVKEESYFHKEEIQQLKDLKKKLKDEKKPEGK